MVFGGGSEFSVSDSLLTGNSGPEGSGFLVYAGGPADRLAGQTQSTALSRGPWTVIWPEARPGSLRDHQILGREATKDRYARSVLRFAEE